MSAIAILHATYLTCTPSEPYRVVSFSTAQLGRRLRLFHVAFDGNVRIPIGSGVMKILSQNLCTYS